MTSGAHQGRTRPRARAAAVALTTVLLLAGCSSGSSSSGSATPSASTSPSPSSSSPSSSPSPSPSASPAAPRAPRARPGAVGQKEFAGYVMGLWSYALRTNNARPLLALAPPQKKCGGCARFAASLAQRRKQGWYVDFPGLTVHSTKVKTINGQSNATAVVDIPQSNSLNRDGSYRNTSRAHRRATFQVRMRLQHKRYQLLSFTVG